MQTIVDGAGRVLGEREKDQGGGAERALKRPEADSRDEKTPVGHVS
jgi:hypothetical protein